jgi:hypothetical protein
LPPLPEEQMYSHDLQDPNCAHINEGDPNDPESIRNPGLRKNQYWV